MTNTKICTCKTDLCNFGTADAEIDSGSKTCYQCSNEDNRFQCSSPSDTGVEIECNGQCAYITYSKYST